MKETTVRPMQCNLVSEGRLMIEKIGAGIGIIIYNSARKIAAGIHVLRALSPGSKVANQVYYAESVIPYALDQLKKRVVLKSVQCCLTLMRVRLGLQILNNN